MKIFIQHQSHGKTRKLNPLVLFLLLITNCSFAQNEKAPLEQLKSFTQNYYYSKGQEERALKVAQFMEDARNYFQKEINFTPKTTLYILAPEDWKDHAAPPLREVYGFPHNVDRSKLVIAAEDNDFWREFLKNVDQLPYSMKNDITKVYGNPDGSFGMMPFFDLLALHEMGHSYTAQAELKMQRHWMSELFANIMLHTYVAEKKPELLPALETFPNMIVNDKNANFKYTSLADFEKLYATLGMGPQNYGWYQCRFHVAAKDIYNAGGKKVMKKLWTALKKHQEKMTDEEFVKMLQKEVHPSVANFYLNWER